MATAFLLGKKFGVPSALGRFNSIDGLRGYLAFFVFLHHASVWYFYLQTGRWELPPSNLYTQFGHSSVFLFFMITGFLFFSKLIDGRTQTIDWGKLFVSRFLRLTPLYLFFVFLLFLLIAYLSNGKLNVSIPQLLTSIAGWLSFTILGTPTINGIGGIVLASVAGATWSLPYEWLFYLALPLLALTVKTKPTLRYIVFSIVGITSLTIWGGSFRPFILIPFLSGIVAALLARSSDFCLFATNQFSTFIALGCIAITVIVYPSALNPSPLFLLSVAFALIACGNNMFGLLTSPVSRTLGEMAYSIYLLHGITLFVTFKFILGINTSKALSPATYWIALLGVTPILICICFTTFHFIESPAMRSSSKVTAWLRSHITKQSKIN
jgi:peptidoglycan/LPS O-acetylase OafA/YrhL